MRPLPALLRAQPLLAAALLAAVAGVAILALAQANASFADAAGFSGRTGGQTCVACHAPPHPFADDAQAILEGLPQEWEPATTYALEVAVLGGPDPLPPPAPQGGFDLATSSGVLSTRGQDDLRQVAPTEATYQPAGTLRRSWALDWTAPDLRTEPAPARFWLAVLSANGNHVVATNASDLGEAFDAADAIVVDVPPSPAAAAAWRAIPLLAPEARLDAAALRIDGRHLDANATHLAVALDGKPWASRPTAVSWVVELDPSPGTHSVLLRSDGANRTGAPIEVRYEVSAAGAREVSLTQDAPSLTTPVGVAAVLAIALLARRHALRNLP